MKAHFFCENCSREVQPNAKSCPYCGRVFSAIRCPSCGFEGTASEMLNGCPVCGYLAEDSSRGARGAPVPRARRKVRLPAENRPRQEPAGPRLPPAFYRAAIIVLAAALAALLLVVFLRGQ
jgi:hypothetical protein